MKWATRSGIKVGRAATAWLIRRFIDPDAEFVFLASDDEVCALEREAGAIGFQVKGARYPHVDEAGRTPFEALASEYRADDIVLQRIARIVHDADIKVPAPAPEAAGLRLITRAFPLVANDDQEIVDRSAFLYDALYAGVANDIGRRPQR